MLIEILGYKKEVRAPGERILGVLPTGDDYADGTSFAAAYVTGIAALIKSVNPALSSKQIGEILKKCDRAYLDKNSIKVTIIDSEKCLSQAKNYKGKGMEINMYYLMSLLLILITISEIVIAKKLTPIYSIILPSIGIIIFIFMDFGSLKYTFIGFVLLLWMVALFFKVQKSRGKNKK